MITVKEFPDQSFETKEDLFKALRDNKKALIAQKKMQTKHADSVSAYAVTKEDVKDANKADAASIKDANKITVKSAINTINVLDSHGDVHLPGIWNKSVKERKDLYLLQEHQMKFDHIISDKVKASVDQISWSDLGVSYSGKTEVLMFESEISKEDSPFMFDMYVKGKVKNHSVGMRYVKMQLALNSDSKYDVEEKEVWDKYIDQVVNKEQAEAQGYFWAVHEAKIIEGSAVPVGSNTITPTITTEAAKSTSEKTEPEATTQFNVSEAIQNMIINL